MFFCTSRKIHESLKLARQTFIRTLIYHNHGRGKPSRILSTLLPSRIQPEDIIDISGFTRPSVGLLPALHATHALHYIAGRAGKPSKFPQNTKGFLYFHSPGPTAPSSLFSLRFRLCGSAEEARNGGGKDLMLPNGRDPWKMNMRWMVKNGIVDALAENGTIAKPPTSQDLAIYDTLSHGTQKVLVYKPGQTFRLTVDHRKKTYYYSLYVVGDGEVVPLVMKGWKALRAMLSLQEDLTLYLHLALSKSGHTADPIQICLSQDASSQLNKGMVLPCVRIRRHYTDIQPMGTPNEEDTLQSALRILTKQMQLENA